MSSNARFVATATSSNSSRHTPFPNDSARHFTTFNPRRLKTSLMSPSNPGRSKATTRHRFVPRPDALSVTEGSSGAWFADPRSSQLRSRLSRSSSTHDDPWRLSSQGSSGA